MDGISRETFKRMDTDSKLNVLFDYLVESNKTCAALDEKIVSLNMKAARWGGVGGIITAAGAYLAAIFIGHITK